MVSGLKADLFITSSVCIVLMASLSEVVGQVIQPYQSLKEDEQQRQQQEKQQAPQLPIQVIRSVNPSPVIDNRAVSNQARIIGLGAFFPVAMSQISRSAQGGAKFTKIAINDDGDADQLQIMGSKDEGVVRSDKNEALRLLLQELPMLDIEALNGAVSRGGPKSVNNNDDKQKQQQQEQSILVQAEDLSPNAVLIGTNRLKGRSAVFLLPTTAVGVNQIAPSFKLVPGAFGLDGGMDGFQKLAPNRHVPCFFNAITCF